MELGNHDPHAPNLKRRMRVLLVDDSKFQQSMLVGYLRGLGVESLVASNGEEALGIILEGLMLDLIIMDKDMPEMNGIQATKKLRDMGVTTMIVGINADTERKMEQEVQDARVDEFIPKPNQMEKFISLLEEIGRRKYDNE